MDCLGQEKNTNEKKKLNKSKIIKITIIFICIALFISCTVLYQNNEKIRSLFDVYIFRKVINEEKVPSIEIDTSKNINIFAYDKYIAILDQNVLKLYNKLGNEEQSLDIDISNPLYEANNKYLCVAEKGGKKLYLISNKNIVWQKEIEGEISSVSVNKNGYVSVTISGTSYKTVVQTFDSKGNGLFKNYLSTTNVIDTDISNDNKYLAIAEANFSGIITQSSIKIISIEDAKINSADSIKYTHIAKANDLIINIKYNSKNDLVCMYDEHIDILRNNENSELVNLASNESLFADINLSSKVVRVVKKTEGLFNTYAELQIISNNVEDAKTYKIENTPKKICTYGDMIAINLGTSIMFIKDNGWLVKKYESNKKEIQNVIVCDGIAGVISKDKVFIVSL